jgi:hypothetical protein
VRVSLLVLLWTALAAGCGGEGEGTVTVTAYGESFIEEGIPTSAVDDGWAIDFSRFQVGLRDVKVAGADIAVPASVELTKPSSGKGHSLGTAQVPEGDHSDAGFTIARVEVNGTATKGTVTKTFAWVFEQPTVYSRCETTTKVTADGSATFQITVHADHLFYDSMAAAEPKLLFQAVADADADSDGEVTQAELTAQGIGAYDPGSEGGIDDLWSWLTAQTRTLGHVDGEGHCHTDSSS